MSNKRYNFPGDEIKPFQTRLLYVTSSVYGNDWHSTLHSHHFTELFYVLSGKGSFLLEEKKISVTEGDMIMINPYVTHTETSLGEHPMEYIALGIEGLLFMDAKTSNQSDYQLHNFNACKNDILFYLKALLHEVSKEENHYEIICKYLLDILVINIVRKTDYSLSISGTKKMSKQCAAIKHYIDSNFTENITLDYLADSNHMNKYYLVHAFQKYMGISPINYLINLRIEESKNLLKTTNHSLLEISSIVGFSSQSYFSQSFKKNTGISPIAYRKEQNNAMENRNEVPI